MSLTAEELAGLDAVGTNLNQNNTDYLTLESDAFNSPAGNTSNNYVAPGAYSMDASGFRTDLTGLAGLANTIKNFATDNKGLMLGAGALLGAAGGNDPRYGKTGYQGTVPNLAASRSMITAPPTKEMGYRPGAGGIDYGGDVSYTRMAPGTDPWANLRGNTGSLAGANLTGTKTVIPGGTKTTTVTGGTGKDTVTGGTKTDTITGGGGNDQVNLGSKGYQLAMAAGLTPAQYLNNINQWILDNPRASRAQIDAALKQFDVSQEDLQEALRTTTFSDATKYGLTHGMGLQEMNQNVENWLRANPYATNEQIQQAMKDVRMNDEDIARAMYGLNSSAAKEYAVVHDMGLDQLYKNILDYQAAGHSAQEVADVMSQYGIEQRDINAANKYAADTGYVADPTSYAGVGDYSDLGGTSGGDTGGGDVQAPTGGLDTTNDIYQYFADPATQAALASGDVRSIAETMQSLGWSPEEVAAATGTNAADVQAQYDAAMASTNDRYAAGGEIAMAKGRYLQGQTDGMADKLPARIGRDQPAALSHGEFVIPADVVSHMGNGNSDAGAKKLYQMMDKIRMARTGTKKQGKRINPDKFMPGGLAKAAKGFDEGGFTGTGANFTEDGRPIDHSYVSLSEYQNAKGQPHTDYEGLTYDAAGGSRIQTPQGERYFSPYGAQPTKEELDWLTSQPANESLNAMSPSERAQTLESWQKSRPGYVDPMDFTDYESYAGAAGIQSGKDEGNDLQNRANFYGMTIENYQNALSGDSTKPMGQFQQVYGNELLSPIEQIAAQTARGQGFGEPNARVMELIKKNPEVFNSASQRWTDYMAKTFPGTLEYESVLKGPSVYDRTGMKKAYGGGIMKLAKGGTVKRFQTGGTTSVGSAANSGVTGVESNLSNWAGDYVTNMLGQGQALANMPYTAYMGPLTAGASPLQTGAFQTATGLATPSSIGTAASTAGGIAAKAQDLAYKPTTETFGTTQAQAYMNPYLESALKPQLDEARRQSQITQQQNAAKMTQAGAFGGSRQAILDAETQRNLATTQAGITGQGYSTAYDKAMAQFNADQARKAQEAQFGATYGLQGLQTGLQGAQTQGNLGATEAQTGLANLRAQLEAGAAERGIESEGIAADKAQFEEARANPYKMVQFQQSLLQGLPLAAQSYNMAAPSTLTQAAQGATTVADLLDILSGKAPAKKI